MSAFSRLFLRQLLLAAGFFCLILATGCLVPPHPKRLASNQTVLAVRYDAHSNIIERLTKKESEFWWEGGISIAEPNDTSHYVHYGRRIYADRTNQPSIRYSSLESVGRDISFYYWFADDWCFRPIAETNLWVAIHGATRFYGQLWRTNKGGDLEIDVYIAAPEKLRVRQLIAFAPVGRRWFPELAFDAANQHLIYRTRSGYESYDLLADTIAAIRQPSECTSLVPRDFGATDTEDKQMWWEARGTNYWAALVTGPRDEYSRYTNQFVIRVFNDLSGKPIYRQEISTRTFADLPCLRFDKSDHMITYKSGDDDFAYSVLENRLEKREEKR